MVPHRECDEAGATKRRSAHIRGISLKSQAVFATVIATLACLFSAAGPAAARTSLKVSNTSLSTSVSAPTVPFGFNDNGVAQGVVTPAEDALLESQAGATVVRVTVPWQWVEQQPGKYNFSFYDALYSALIARGLHPLWTPMFAPSWAISSSTPCNQYTQTCHYPPAPQYDQNYAGFAAYLATRYPQSAGIEVWNEENLDFFWQPAPDPSAYTQLLQTTYTMVKKYAPNMPVVMGGLSDVNSSDPKNINLGQFLYDIYQDGGRNYTDAINVHPYPLPGNDMSQFNSAMWTTRYVRNYFGDNNRPIWVTEVGVSTNGGQVTPQQQASDLTYLYNTLAGQSDVKMILVHTLVDPNNTTPFEAGFGVVNPNLTPSPAYCALAKLRGSTYPCVAS